MFEKCEQQVQRAGYFSAEVMETRIHMPALVSGMYIHPVLELLNNRRRLRPAAEQNTRNERNETNYFSRTRNEGKLHIEEREKHSFTPNFFLYLF